VEVAWCLKARFSFRLEARKMDWQKAFEMKKDYPTIIIDYVYTRYRGEFLKDVIKAAIWVTWWKRLTEAEREEITREAIRMAGERGFKEPVIG
jgi:hypothetical protein